MSVCRFCGERFTNNAKLGGHVHARHPEHKRPAPKWLRATSPREPRPSLKRATDIWPARP